MKLFGIIIIVCVISCKSQVDDTGKLKMAISLLQSDKIYESDSIYKAIKEYKNENDFDYKLLGLIILFKQKKYEKSLEASMSFVDKYSKSILGYYYAGLSEYNLARYKNALMYFKQSLSKLGNFDI